MTLWCNAYGGSCEKIKMRKCQKPITCGLCMAHVKLKGDTEVLAKKLADGPPLVTLKKPPDDIA